MIDSCDRWTLVLRQKRRKARKPHKCSECCRVIGRGETYEATIAVTEGEFDDDRCCLHCRAGRDWLEGECGGYVYRALEEDLREHWHEDRIRTRRLALLIWGMRRQWRRRDGRLMDVPTPEVGTRENLQ